MPSCLRAFVILFLTAYCLLPTAYCLAEARKTWLFTLITPSSTAPASGGVSAYETGNTTASKQSDLTTGVSNMARRHGPVTDELKSDPYVIDITETNGIFMARVLDVDPSQAVAGVSQAGWGVTGWPGSYSGTTFYVFVKTAQKNTPGDWAAAQMEPIFQKLAISGATPEGRMFKFRPARYMKAFFMPSGVTPYDNAQLEITAGFDPAVDVPAYTIAEGSFAMPASGMGASTFTAASIGAWPGGEYIEFQAGNSLYVTADGTAPTTTGTGLVYTVQQVGSASGAEARALQFKTIGAQTVSYRILNRKP